MCCYQTKLQTLEREISRAAQAVTAAQGQIKTAKSAHRKILNSRDSSQAAMTIVQRNLEGAREDGDADEIKKFSDQLALAQTQSPAENFSQQLKKSELKVKQLDEKLQHAAVHKQLHKEARRSLFVLSRRRPIVTHRSSLWIFFSSSFFVFFFFLCNLSGLTHQAAGGAKQAVRRDRRAGEAVGAVCFSGTIKTLALHTARAGAHSKTKKSGRFR